MTHPSPPPGAWQAKDQSQPQGVKRPHGEPSAPIAFQAQMRGLICKLTKKKPTWGATLQVDCSGQAPAGDVNAAADFCNISGTEYAPYHYQGDLTQNWPHPTFVRWYPYPISNVENGQTTNDVNCQLGINLCHLCPPPRCLTPPHHWALIHAVDELPKPKKITSIKPAVSLV